MSIRNYVPKTKKALWYKPPKVVLGKPTFSSIKRKPWSPLNAGLLTKKKLKNYATAFSTTEDAPKRQRVRAMSKKLSTARRTYNARVKVWLEGKQCAVFPHLPATQCHHTRGRAGKLLLDERFWLAVSAEGHDFIHRYPATARAKGWLCELGLWNSQST